MQARAGKQASRQAASSKHSVLSLAFALLCAHGRRCRLLTRSMSGMVSQILYDLIVFVFSKTRLVTFSGAGPPFSPLYLMPKSSSMPPGLCDAERMKPPKGAMPARPRARVRTTADSAGVESRPSVPHHTRATPAAAAILMTCWQATSFQKRPSPETTRVPPSIGTFSSTSASKTDCTKLFR